MKFSFVTFIGVVLLAFNLNAQVELNGVMLGSKIEVVNQDITFMGEDYIFMTQNTKDGRCAMMGITPAGYAGFRKISKNEFNILKEVIEDIYKIKLEFVPKNILCKHIGDWMLIKDGIYYLLSVNKYKRFRSLPYELDLFIYNMELYDTLMN